MGGAGHLRTIPPVGGPGPDDPGDPFANLPFFGDLSKLLGQQGPIAWDAASRLALTLASGGESEPNIDPSVRMSIEELGRVADLRVAAATGLSTVVGGRPPSVVAVSSSPEPMTAADVTMPGPRNLSLPENLVGGSWIRVWSRM